MVREKGSLRVYLNGVLMKQGDDYAVAADPDTDSHPPMITWVPGGIGDHLTQADQIQVEYDHWEEPSAVDQLAEVTLPAEEVERRRRRRQLNILMQTPVQLGISSRGNGMPR